MTVGVMRVGSTNHLIDDFTVDCADATYGHSAKQHERIFLTFRLQLTTKRVVPVRRRSRTVPPQHAQKHCKRLAKGPTLAVIHAQNA